MTGRARGREEVAEGRGIGLGGINVSLDLCLIVGKRILHIGLVEILYPAFGFIDDRALCALAN